MERQRVFFFLIEAPVLVCSYITKCGTCFPEYICTLFTSYVRKMSMILEDEHGAAPSLVGTWSMEAFMSIDLPTNAREVGAKEKKRRRGQSWITTYWLQFPLGGPPPGGRVERWKRAPSYAHHDTNMATPLKKINKIVASWLFCLGVLSRAEAAQQLHALNVIPLQVYHRRTAL